MRVTNRVVSALLAAAIAAAGVIAIGEMVNAALDNSHSIVNWQSAVNAMSRNTWSDTGPTVFGAILTAVGALLLLLGLRRGRVAWFALQPVSPSASAFVSSDGLSRSLRAAAVEVDGVVRAKVKVRRRTATVRIELRPRTAEDAPARVLDRLHQQITSVGLLKPPKMKLKASRSSSRDTDIVAEPPLVPASPVPPEVPPTATATPTPTPTPTGTGSNGPTSVTAENFGTSPAVGRTTPYPPGLDLTKPDPTGGGREPREEQT